MTLFQVYLRVLGMLSGEKWLAVRLALANAVIGVIHLAEPILFGRVVDALAKNANALGYISMWAALGLTGILASVVVAVTADRLAHRQRLAAMSRAFERAITLPISYHAQRGTGAIVRNIIAGTDCLFVTWLSVLREQFSAIVTLVCLVPVAYWMNWRLALLLTLLAVVYATLNVLVINRTTGGQAAVERYHVDLSGRVGDVISNVPVWGLAAVLTRAASTITMVAVFATGAWMAARGEITVGEIVSFVGFAGLLIGHLDQVSGFVTRLFMQAPTLKSYFELVDAAAMIEDRPTAKALTHVAGKVTFDHVTFRYGPDADGVFEIDFTAEAILPAQGELIATDGADEVRAPCDRCTVLMPTRAPVVGREGVYLARPMD